MQGFPPPPSDYGGLLSSPGFSHGFNLWCRLSSITHLSLTAHALLASLPSVCHLSHLYHHAPLRTSASRLQTQSASRESCSCCIRLISNRWNIIQHLSLISIRENEETVKAQTGPKINIRQAFETVHFCSAMHFCFVKHEMRAMEWEKCSRLVFRRWTSFKKNEGTSHN